MRSPAWRRPGLRRSRTSNGRRSDSRGRGGHQMTMAWSRPVGALAGRALGGIHAVAIVPLALVLGPFLLGAVAAHAATFAVNSTIDVADAMPGDGVCESAPGNGVCTLRAAVDEANALAGPDSVDMPGGLFALLSGELHVIDDLTISGAGASATIIDGGGGRGIFVAPVTANIGGVTARNLGVVNGYSSGAIVNAGTLTLTDSVVSANLVGGIYDEGTLTVE